MTLHIGPTNEGASQQSVEGAAGPRGEEAMEHVVIWSDEHFAYWRPNGNGYTTGLATAGVFARSWAEKLTAHCGPEKQIQLRSLAEEIAKYEEPDTVLAALRSRIEGAAVPEPEKLLADLVAAIDRCQPGIDGAFMLAHVHGSNYNGPTYSQELQRAREYLALHPSAEKVKGK